jgi:hypothetical protein
MGQGLRKRSHPGPSNRRLMGIIAIRALPSISVRCSEAERAHSDDKIGAISIFEFRIAAYRL